MTEGSPDPFAVFGLRKHAPCTLCGGTLFSDIYYNSSPTWRSNTNSREGAVAMAAMPDACSCGECDACGVAAKKGDLKRCSGCKTAWLCSDACMRRFWPQHKAECLAESARRAAAAATAKK